MSENRGDSATEVQAQKEAAKAQDESEDASSEE